MIEDAISIARKIRAKQLSASAATKATLEQIRLRNPAFNCFTTILEQQALQQSEDIDRRIAAGQDPGPLAGVPFAVKNLFDIAGVTTLAGSKIYATRPPADQDATAVERLKKAGAVLVGALNMDEYAYGFTTENTHYGPTRNPHDPERVPGALRVDRRRPSLPAWCR